MPTAADSDSLLRVPTVDQLQHGGIFLCRFHNRLGGERNRRDAVGYSELAGAEADRARTDKAGEMCKEVEETRGVKVGAGGVYDDDGVLIVAGGIAVGWGKVERAAVRVEKQIPVNPAGRARLHLADDAVAPCRAVGKVSARQGRRERRVGWVVDAVLESRS